MCFSFDVSHPAWSCAWKGGETHYVFVGLANGQVLLYDTRMLFATDSQDLNEYVAQIANLNISKAPVISLHWVPSVSQANNRYAKLTKSSTSM